MKNKIIIFLLISLMGFSLIGCDNPNRTITGTVVELSESPSYEENIIKLKTEDGDIDFYTDPKTLKALNVDLKVSLTYNYQSFIVSNITFPSSQQ